MNDAQVRKEILNIIGESEDSFITIGERSVRTSLQETARLVHFFASTYGLGGCRSITEFWDMVDREDPVKLELLKIVAHDMDKEQYEDDTKPSSHRNTQTSSTRSTPDAVDVVSDIEMADFLHKMGVPPKDIENAIQKNKKRTIVNTDLSDITTERLAEKDFDLKEALVRINKRQAQSVNFQVSWKTLKDSRQGQ